ncbi:MAG: MFS transporter, partial [Bacteroidota bacterium]
VGMRISPLQSLLTALVPDSRRGILMSLAVACGQVGVGIGSSAAALTYESHGYLSNTVIGAVALFLMAYIIYRMIPEPNGDFSADGRASEPLAPARVER